MMYKRWLGGILGISAAKKIALEELAGHAGEVYRMGENNLKKTKLSNRKGM